MVAIREHLTAAAVHQLVESLGQADTKALEASCQRRTVGGFDDQMHMVALDGELAQPHTEAICRHADGAVEDAERASAAQIPHVRQHSQRHMHGKPGSQERSAPVWNPSLRSLWLAPSPLARTTPSSQLEPQLNRLPRALRSHRKCTLIQVGLSVNPSLFRKRNVHRRRAVGMWAPPSLLRTAPLRHCARNRHQDCEWGGVQVDVGRPPSALHSAAACPR